MLTPLSAIQSICLSQSGHCTTASQWGGAGRGDHLPPDEAVARGADVLVVAKGVPSYQAEGGGGQAGGERELDCIPAEQKLTEPCQPSMACLTWQCVNCVR